MPEDCNLPTPDQLGSFSESITLPYEELKELKAAAEVVGSRNGLSVTNERCVSLPPATLSFLTFTPPPRPTVFPVPPKD